MKGSAQVFATAVLSLAALASRPPRTRRQTRRRSAPSRRAPALSGRVAANFFCSTEEEIAAMKILPSATEGDVEGQRAEPMKVFDNLYFVGQKAVTTWAITTSDGIILIDAGYPERFDDTLLAGLKKLGLDPRRIKAALIAHEHADHFGGARLLQERLGTKIAMSQAAWDGLEPKARRAARRRPGRAAQARDGHDRGPAGHVRRHQRHPGGHPRAYGRVRWASCFAVKDGARTHMAALFGGSILNPQRRFPASTVRGVLWPRSSISPRCTKQQQVDVELLNHPIMDGLFDQLES